LFNHTLENSDVRAAEQDSAAEDVLTGLAGEGARAGQGHDGPAAFDGYADVGVKAREVAGGGAGELGVDGAGAGADVEAGGVERQEAVAEGGEEEVVAGGAEELVEEAGELVLGVEDGAVAAVFDADEDVAAGCGGGVEAETAVEQVVVGAAVEFVVAVCAEEPVVAGGAE
jgi:hypothetical protein